MFTYASVNRKNQSDFICLDDAMRIYEKVTQRSSNPQVAGSNPAGRAKFFLFISTMSGGLLGRRLCCKLPIVWRECATRWLDPD